MFSVVSLGLTKFSQAAAGINLWIDQKNIQSIMLESGLIINISLLQQNEDIHIGFVDSWYNRRLGPRIPIFRQK